MKDHSKEKISASGAGFQRSRTPFGERPRVLARRALHWYVFLGTVGAASTAVEIAGLRFLAPIYGTSLPVWGAAIATVIAGLAAGYSHGGRLARRAVTPFLVAEYAALGAVLFLFMPAIFALAKSLSGISSVMLAFLILFIPSLIFGTVSPLAVQAEADRRKKPAGEVAGKISTLTTIGSLIGILLPSFITIPLLGTRETTWIFAGAVLIVSLPLLRASQRLLAAGALFAVSAAGLSLIPELQNSNVIFAAETPYQHVAVHQIGEKRTLTFDANLGTQSLFTPRKYTEGYWDYLAALPALLPQKSNLKVLVLGAAASTTERHMQRFWEESTLFDFTSVELDGDLFEIAAKFFDPPHHNRITADARAFVQSDQSLYDIVVVDTYARELTIPFHLATREFFESIRPRLAPAGVLAMNVNASSVQSLWIQSLARTLQAVFPHLALVHVPDSCNYLMLASHQPLTSPDVKTLPPDVARLTPVFSQASLPATEGLLLTDNRAPTDWLGIAALLDRSDSTC